MEDVSGRWQRTDGVRTAEATDNLRLEIDLGLAACHQVGDFVAGLFALAEVGRHSATDQNREVFAQRSRCLTASKLTAPQWQGVLGLPLPSRAGAARIAEGDICHIPLGTHQYDLPAMGEADASDFWPTEQAGPISFVTRGPTHFTPDVQQSS